MMEWIQTKLQHYINFLRLTQLQVTQKVRVSCSLRKDSLQSVIRGHSVVRSSPSYRAAEQRCSLHNTLQPSSTVCEKLAMIQQWKHLSVKQ